MHGDSESFVSKNTYCEQIVVFWGDEKKKKTVKKKNENMPVIYSGHRGCLAGQIVLQGHARGCRTLRRFGLRVLKEEKKKKKGRFKTEPDVCTY